jgi:hypothetical protein
VWFRNTKAYVHFVLVINVLKMVIRLWNLEVTMKDFYSFPLNNIPVRQWKSGGVPFSWNMGGYPTAMIEDW